MLMRAVFNRWAPIIWGRAVLAGLARHALLLACLWIFSPFAHAQLAGSFLNVTGISVKRLPNAVQVRIETDGTLRFGGDYNDWIDTQNGWNLKPTTSVRLRIVQARAKLPAYVPLDAYPIDGAAISLGRSEFKDPWFSDNGWDQPEPRVDVELRFATPVLIRQFRVEPNRGTWFGDYLNPREVAIEMAPNRRAIIITAIPDRADLSGQARLQRLPEAQKQTRLSVSKSNGGARIEALHAPLRTLLGELSGVMDTRFLAREDVQNLPVTLVLNDATSDEIVRALEVGANLGTRRDADGTLVFGRGDEFFEAKTFALSHLTPDEARLLFPDFLLPFLRADRQNNALLAFQTPRILRQIERDLRVLDVPRAQFQIEAQIWEVARTRDSEFAFSLLRSIGQDAQNFDVSNGLSSVTVAPNLSDQIRVSLQALSSRGFARLRGAPRVSVASGENGSIFLGQTRYIKILQQRGNQQIAQALPLQIGTELRVSPRGGNGSDAPITLQLTPRSATVDSLEAETGLPTLGIRESSATLRLRSGESVLLGGLDADLNFQTERKTLRAVPSPRRSREKRELVVLIRAEKLSQQNPSQNPLQQEKN